jgi:hypothetical protein
MRHKCGIHSFFVFQWYSGPFFGAPGAVFPDLAPKRNLIDLRFRCSPEVKFGRILREQRRSSERAVGS